MENLTKPKKATFRLRFLEFLGFEIYNKWSVDQFLDIFYRNGYEVVKSRVIYSKPLSEAVLIAKKYNDYSTRSNNAL